MKFLCLHGRGTNSDIFESQLGSLFSKISPEHQFDFIDAPFECSAAPGIGQVYPGPYLAWFSQYAPEDVDEVHSFVNSIVEEDGPYDGIIGFSQGASLAASILLSHEHRRAQAAPDNKPSSPFKVAIFFNSVMLFSPSESIGSDITEQIKQQEEKYMGFLQGVSEHTQPSEDPEIAPSSPSAPKTPSTITWKMPNWGSSSTSLSSLSTVSSEEDESPREVQIARKRSVAMESVRLLKSPKVYGFQPASYPHQISVPTLHVIGRDDEFAEHSHALVKLCQASKAEVLVVDGAHDLPRTKEGLKECARLFDMVTLMAALGST